MKSKQFYNTTAWKWFRKYHILNQADNDFNIRCRTSGRFYTLPDKRVHLGHYIKVFDGNSTNFATAFDDRNVLPQSYSDNKYFSGKPDVMRHELIKDWGLDEIQLLEIRKHNFCKLGKFELDLISDEYRKKYNDLKKIKGSPF